jgi:cytochrome b561
MTGLPLGFTKLQAYNWHKWIGLTVLALTALRLLWRWRNPPPPLPDAVTRWERALAPFGHWALLILLVAMPISGWSMSSAAGINVIWFGVLPLPDLVPARPRSFRDPAYRALRAVAMPDRGRGIAHCRRLASRCPAP